jgi:hypothetical protein
MIIGGKNTDLKRLTGRLKLRFLTEIGIELADYVIRNESCKNG